MNIYFDNSGTYIKNGRVIIEMSLWEALIILGIFIVVAIVIFAILFPK